MTDKKTKINPTLIRNIANILNETNLTEIEVDGDGVRIRLLRSPQKDPSINNLDKKNEQVNYVLESKVSQLTEDSNSKPIEDNNSRLSTKNIQIPIPDNSLTVTSPMVGTAYLASSPGSDPFVNKGNLVVKGQTLLIIEAMKTMNHIIAPCPGTVVSINVENGQLVEYGDSLVVLEKKEDNK
ncbi:acetyl-CoA carboxylase biotin carboxyl carrier protein [Candidatus Liberibacter brunswickensis]|uniref:acetyl-CoA carboxylase biotin carboxyl carrier protein n=1 Tax=Candidatus Liberibacter brunswickensis TaxID=1968796 RepID=UPI002FE23CF5